MGLVLFGVRLAVEVIGKFVFRAVRARDPKVLRRALHRHIQPGQHFIQPSIADVQAVRADPREQLTRYLLLPVPHLGAAGHVRPVPALPGKLRQLLRREIVTGQVVKGVILHQRPGTLADHVVQTVLWALGTYIDLVRQAGLPGKRAGKEIVVPSPGQELPVGPAFCPVVEGPQLLRRPPRLVHGGVLHIHTGLVGPFRLADLPGIQAAALLSVGVQIVGPHRVRGVGVQPVMVVRNRVAAPCYHLHVESGLRQILEPAQPGVQALGLHLNFFSGIPVFQMLPGLLAGEEPGPLVTAGHQEQRRQSNACGKDMLDPLQPAHWHDLPADTLWQDSQAKALPPDHRHEADGGQCSRPI